MMDESGFDLAGNREPLTVPTAVLPHPLHGRLVERVIPLIRHYLSIGEATYELCWRAGGTAYYRAI